MTSCGVGLSDMRLIQAPKLLSVLLSLYLSSSVQAADTAAPVCSLDPSSALVFVGTLTGLTPAATSSPGWNLATFDVSEFLQGEKSAAVSTLMRKGVCDDSGTTPTVGGTYLVLTHTLPRSSGYHVYQLERCDQVRPLNEATEALGYLRRSLTGSTPTEVSGEAAVQPQGYPWNKIPLPNTKIHLAGANQHLDLTSDADGRFQGVLNPGKYAITTEFPGGYDADFSSPSAITVAEHRCTQIAVSARPNASITAPIVDEDGDTLGPMSNVQLTLETAEDQQFVQSVYPDETSHLEATNLLPGKYILGLNTYLGVFRGSAPYPPIYYPGVSSRSEAQVITLSAGERKFLPEMRIKKGHGCEIPVLVTDKLGKPSPSTIVALAYPDSPHFYFGPHEQTDEKGREAVYAVFPGHVLLRGEKELEDTSTAESEEIELTSCPTKLITVKLTRVVIDEVVPKKK